MPEPTHLHQESAEVSPQRLPADAGRGPIAPLPLPVIGQRGSAGSLPTIRRKVFTGANSTLKDSDADRGVLGPIGSKVRSMMKSEDDYFLPDNPRPLLDQYLLPFVERKIYLFGETHGDGSWGAQTDKYSYVTKLREGLKGFAENTEVERGAAEVMEAQDRGNGPDVERPLEDMGAYLLSRILALQGYLADVASGGVGAYDVKGGSDVAQEAREVSACLDRYVGFVNEMAKSKTESDLRRPGSHFEVARALKAEESTMMKIANKQPTDAKQISALRRELEVASTALIELVDDRPYRDNIFGSFFPRVGGDPVTNRSQIEAMSKASAPTATLEAVVPVTGPLREKAMLRHIRKAGRAPLFVQVGRAHLPGLLERLKADVRDDAVEVTSDLPLDTAINPTEGTGVAEAKAEGKDDRKEPVDTTLI